MNLTSKNRELLRAWGESAWQMKPRKFICGFCGSATQSDKGWEDHYGCKSVNLMIYICSGCDKPTLFDSDGQHPGPLIGNDINHLPTKVQFAWKEARKTFSSGNYTSCVLMCRKILMNTAVSQGANEDERFVDYINYLNTNSLIPSNFRDVIDKVRRLGNEATHEIQEKTKEEAEIAIKFTQIMLQVIFECPNDI